MRVMKIKFDARVEKKIIEELKKVIDHHIEQLIDLDSWMYIESVWGAKLEITEENNSTKYSEVKIEFAIRVDENAISKLERSVDHHIEWLVDLDGWPEIISVWGAKLTDICDAVDYDKLNGGEQNE